MIDFNEAKKSTSEYKKMNMYLGTFNISFETCVSNLVGKPGTLLWICYYTLQISNKKIILEFFFLKCMFL